MAKKKQQKTTGINPNSPLGRYIENSGDKLKFTPNKTGWNGVLENYRQRVELANKDKEKKENLFNSLFRNTFTGTDKTTTAAEQTITTAQAPKQTPAQNYFDQMYNQAQTAGQELYRNSFLYKPAQAQPVQTTVPTAGTQPATAEDVSKSVFERIAKNLGMNTVQPEDMVGTPKAAAGTPTAKNTGAATGTGKATGSGNVDAIDRVLYGSNRAERFTSKVPKVEMQTAPATGKSAPVGGEVPMPEEQAPQKKQQEESKSTVDMILDNIRKNVNPIDFTKPVSQRKNVFEGTVFDQGQQEEQPKTKQQEWTELIGGIRQKQYEEQKKEYDRQYKEWENQYDNWLWHTDSSELTSKEDRDRKRQLIEQEKASLSQQQEYYNDPGSMRQRKIGEMEYLQTPQGQVRRYYELGDLEGINATIRNNPEVFDKYDLPEWVDWTALNPLGGNLIDTIAPSIGTTNSKEIQKQIMARAQEYDKMLAELDEADEKWGPINKYESEMAGESDFYNPDAVYTSALGDGYNPNLAGNTDLRRYEGEYTLGDITNELEQVYEVAYNRYKYTAEDGRYDIPAVYMDDTQTHTFMALMNLDRRDEAKAYYDAIKPYLNQQKTKHYTERAKQLAEAGSGSEYTMGLGSVGMEYIAGWRGIEGTVRSLFGDKEAQDPNSDFYMPANVSTAIREQSAENTGRKFEKAFGKPGYEYGKYLNGVYYSVLDNLFNVLAAGGAAGDTEMASEALTLLTMSDTATTHAFVNYRNNDVPPVLASLLAIGEGLIEAGTEKMGYDAIFKPKASEFMGNALQLSKFMVKSGLSETAEEATGSVAKMLLQKAASTFTEFETDIERDTREYIKDKKAKNHNQYTSADIREWTEEGRKKAWRNYWKETALDALAGFISSGPMVGARVISNIGAMSAIGSEIKNGGYDATKPSEGLFRQTTAKENIDYLIEIARTMDTESNSFQLADKLKKRSDAGKKISNYDLGRLAMNLEYETSEQIGKDAKDAVVGVITGELKDQGVEGTEAKELAELIHKAKTKGIDALNRRERNKLSGNVAASQIYMEMMEKGDQDVSAAVSEAAQKTAKDAKEAALSATKENRVKLNEAQSIISGKGGYTINEAKIGKDSLTEARKSVGTASEETIQAMGGRDAIGNAASAVIAYTNDQKNGNDAKAGQVVGFENGKVKVQLADGTETTMDPAYVETMDGNAQGIIGYMKSNAGMMSDNVATKAMAALDSIGDEAAPNFAQDIVEINLAARLGRAMPKGISIREDIANEIYNTAHSEFEAAEQKRIEEGGDLNPGKGTLKAGEIKYGTSEWTEKFGNLSKTQKDQLYVANRFAEIFGFDIDVFQEEAIKDENGNPIQKQGYQTGNKIGLNIAGKMVDLGGKEFVRNMLNALDHEGTHWIQKHSLEGYRQLVNFVLDNLEKSGKYNLQQEIKDKIELYNEYYQETKQQRKATIDDAIFEIVADSSDQIFQSKEMEQRLRQEAPEAHKSIKNYIKQLVARLRNALTGIHESGSYESRVIRKFGGLEAIDEMARIWLGAYDEAIHREVVKQETGVENPAMHAEKVGGKTYSAEEINSATKILDDAKSEPVNHFSLTAPVQVRKDGMVAVHNLDERSLLSDLAMKGFPMPSIAVLSDKVAWEDYGPISIFFGENAVEFDDGTVYAGDAYTPAMGNYQATSAEDALAFLRQQKLRNPKAAYSTMDLFNNFIRVQNMDLAREKVNAYRNMDKTERVAEKRRIKAIENSIMDQVAEFLDREENTNRYTRTEDRFNFDVAYGIMLAAEEMNGRENLSQQEKYEILQESLEKAAQENDSPVYDYGKDGNALYDDMLEFIDGASRLASTFIESKPNRILDFGAVNAVVLPNDVQESTIQALKDAGVENIITYDPSVKNARVEALQNVPKSVPNVSFSIQQLDDGTKFVEVDTDQDQFKGLKPKEILKMASKIIRKKFVTPERSKNLYEFTDGDKAYIDAKTADEYAYTSKTKLKEAAKRAKGKAAPELDNLIKIATEIKPGDVDYPNPSNHPYKGDTIGFKYYKTLFKVGGRFFTGIINVEDKGTHKRIKDITQIKIDESRSWPNDNTSRQADDTSVVAANAYKKNIAQDANNFKTEVEDAIAHPQKSFSITKPVEATKDGLIAVHNLTYDNFIDTLNEGAFTAPSVAVVKAAMGHSKYGDISVVFKKDAIDPQKNSKNKIYGADAYTPTRYNADVETELIYDKMLEIRDNLTKSFDEKDETQNKLRNELERWFSEKTYKEVTNKTPEQLADEAYNNEALMAAYLKEQGKEIPIKTREEYKGNYTQQQADEFEKVFQAVGKYIWSGEFQDDVEHLSGKKLVEKYGDLIASKIERADKLLKIYKEKGSKLAGTSLMRMMKGTVEWLNGGNEKVTETDWYETKKAMWEMIDKQSMIDWMAEKIRPAYGQTGIRNNLDPFTAMGNRRSFKQLHTPYTIENVVKAMYQNATEKGQGGRYATGAIATASKEYKTLQEVHDDAARLEMKSDEEYDAIIEELNQRMNNMAEEYGEDMRYFDYAVMEAGRNYAKRQTLDAIKRGFADENVSITTEQAQKVKALLDDMREIPTGYFEAKMMRVARFEEIADVIIPEKYDRLIAELEKRNIPYTTTDGTEEARKEALNNVKSEQFSITRQHPDMDVKVWMDSVPESSLATEAERELLRQYKSLRIAIDLDRERQKNYKKRIAELEAKGDSITKEEKRMLDGLKIRLQNSESTQAQHEAKMERITSDKGFAGMMYAQQQLMNDYVQGKTQDEVIAAVSGMEKAAETLKNEIGKTAEELKALAEEEGVRRVRSRIGTATLDKVAARIRKNYNSTINKQELQSDLARIRLMMESGAEYETVAAEIEDLAGRILEERRSSEKNQSLENLRGVTLRLGDAALKEIYGSNSNMKEIRKMLAGSGVKIERMKGDGGSLDANWDELVSFVPALDHYNGYDTDNALDQAKAVAEFVMNAMEEQKESGKNEFAGMMDQVFMDLSGELANIDMNLPADPSARKQVQGLVNYIMDLSKRTKMAGSKVSELEAKLEALVAGGKKAASWSRAMKADVQQTIDYFNKTAKMAVDQAKRNRQDAIIQQLKSENVQKMMKANDEWRALIQRDADARRQAEKNALSRRKMSTVMNRINKLLSSETDQQNIPENYKGLARELLGLFVDNDRGEGGRKLTNASKTTLDNTKRLLDIWEQQDGPYDPGVFTYEGTDDEKAIGMIVADDLSVIRDAMAEWNNKYKGKNKLDTLQQMGKTLERMQEATSEIYQIIQSARTMDLNGRKYQVEEMALKFLDGVKNSRFKGEMTSAVGKKLETIKKLAVTGNITPEYFFKNLKNAGLDEIWNEFKRAENKNGLEIAKAKDKLGEIAEKYGYKSWDQNKKHTVQTLNGTVEMTTEQLMALWATWKREKTIGPEMSQHLTRGGFYVAEDKKGKGLLGRQKENARAHVMDEATMAKVGEMLTEEQKAYVDEMVGYMSNDLSALGNEASMRMYGIKKYKESYYFPFKRWSGVGNFSSDKGVTASQTENRAAHKGWTKRRTNMASNALEIGNFTKTVADHAVEMINYNTMAPSIEAMNKMLNWQQQEYPGDGTIIKRNMRTVFGAEYGKANLDYLETLLTDLNGGVAQDPRGSALDKLLSTFKKNAVAGSLSVAAQQPLSYIRAAMEINPIYLAKGLNPATWKGSYQEMMAHSGVAVIKEMGRFDMGYGASAKEYVAPDAMQTKRQKIGGAISDFTTALPELMDRVTWTRMWNAVKAEQKALHPDMNVKSDEFLDMVGERFNEVMRRTQVYDSTLVKSSNMRSKNFALKSLTSFMAEPTLSLNVLKDAAQNVRDKGGVKKAAMAGATFLLSAIAQAAVKGFFGTGRNPDDKKTRDENFAYRMLYSLISEMNPMGLIPGYSSLIDTLKDGKLTNNATTPIGKLGDIIQTVADTATGGEKFGYRMLEDTAAQLAQLFTGVPAKNIMRDARAMVNFFAPDSGLTQFMGGKAYANRENSAAVMKYQAIDTIMKEDLIGLVNGLLRDAGYQTTKTAYKERIKEAEAAGDTETAEALRDYTGSTASASEQNTNAYIQEQMKTGKMSSDDARKKIKETYPDRSDDSVWWTVDRMEYENQTGNEVKGSSKTYRLWDAMDNNKADEIGKAIDEMVGHGVKKESIKSSITDKYKKEYLEADNNGKRKIRDAVQKAYKKLGYTAADADKIINGWSK